MQKMGSSDHSSQLESLGKYAGGSLSASFARWPLSLSQPPIIAALYALLIGLATFLPLGVQVGFQFDMWVYIWAVETSAFMLVCAFVGSVSQFVTSMTIRPPIKISKWLLFTAPFVGIALRTVVATGMIPSTGFLHISIILLIGPGLAYVWFIWAPRWRMLQRMEEGKSPIEGLGESSVAVEHHRTEDLHQVLDSMDILDDDE